MIRFIATTLIFAIVFTLGCSGRSSEGSATPTPTPTPSPVTSSAPVMGPVPPVVGGSPGPSVKASIPAVIPDRLRRPLTLEEIMKLPPETRDMILRAQGRPLPSPTKKR